MTPVHQLSKEPKTISLFHHQLGTVPVISTSQLEPRKIYLGSDWHQTEREEIHTLGPPTINPLGDCYCFIPAPNCHLCAFYHQPPWEGSVQALIPKERCYLGPIFLFPKVSPSFTFPILPGFPCSLLLSMEKEWDLAPKNKCIRQAKTSSTEQIGK